MFHMSQTQNMIEELMYQPLKLFKTPSDLLGRNSRSHKSS